MNRRTGGAGPRGPSRNRATASSADFGQTGATQTGEGGVVDNIPPAFPKKSTAEEPGRSWKVGDIVQIVAAIAGVLGIVWYGGAEYSRINLNLENARERLTNVETEVKGQGAVVDAQGRRIDSIDQSVRQITRSMQERLGGEERNK